MAILSCPECKGKVSDKAQACPHCGCPASVAKTTSPLPAATKAQSNGWKTTPKSVSLSNSTLEWLDSRQLWDEFATVGVRGRSGIVQLALEQFYAAHITRDAEGLFHFDGFGNARSDATSTTGGSWGTSSDTSLYH